MHASVIKCSLRKRFDMKNCYLATAAASHSRLKEKKKEKKKIDEVRVVLPKTSFFGCIFFVLDEPWRRGLAHFSREMNF